MPTPAQVRHWLQTVLVPRLHQKNLEYFKTHVCENFVTNFAAPQLVCSLSYMTFLSSKCFALDVHELIALFHPNCFRTIRTREEGGKNFARGTTGVHHFGPDFTIITHGSDPTQIDYVLVQMWRSHSLSLTLINLTLRKKPASKMLSYLLERYASPTEPRLPWVTLYHFYSTFISVLDRDSTSACDRPFPDIPLCQIVDLLRMYDPGAASQTLMMTEESIQRRLRLRVDIIGRHSILFVDYTHIWKLRDGRFFWVASSGFNECVFGTCNARGRIYGEPGPFAY